jgi:hypothetical protein
MDLSKFVIPTLEMLNKKSVRRTSGGKPLHMDVFREVFEKIRALRRQRVRTPIWRSSRRYRRRAAATG